METDPSQLFQYALRLLGRREYSRAELRTKLVTWLKRRQSFSSQSEQEIADLLARLSDEGLQDDDRFAASYTRVCIMKGWGPIKIAHHLRQRGINEETIAKHCQREADFWLEQIHQLMENRPSDNRDRNYRFLLGRGFHSEQVRQALRSKSTM